MSGAFTDLAKTYTAKTGDAGREAAAYRFAFYVLSPEGQALLGRDGLKPVARPSE